MNKIKSKTTYLLSLKILDLDVRNKYNPCLTYFFSHDLMISGCNQIAPWEIKPPSIKTNPWFINPIPTHKLQVVMVGNIEYGKPILAQTVIRTVMYKNTMRKAQSLLKPFF